MFCNSHDGPHFALSAIQNKTTKPTFKSLKGAGFEHSTETTYLALPSDLSVLDQNNEKKRRDSIKCAQGKVVITEDLSTERFIEFCRKHLKIQNKLCYDDLKIVKDIIAIGRAVGNVVIYTAVAKKESVESDVAEVQVGDVVASIVVLYAVIIGFIHGYGQNASAIQLKC